MRRRKHLFDEIVSFQNLLKAAKLAQRGKRFKNSTARFNFQLERELWTLHCELAEKRYEPGRYRDFVVHEPKRRIISAAPYRDRVVHHALHNVLEPIFEPTFIHDSYATRKGKGTHAALDRFQKFARKNHYALKCDVRQYFPSIDHAVLLTLIRRKVGCPDTLWLIERILHSHLPTGIPIGNLTSQFFANVYLNDLDHHVKENLRCRHYLRYMDDFMIFHDEKEFLWRAKAGVQECLRGLRLELHENKCRIFRTEMGVPFLGMIVSPDRRRLRRQNVVRFKRRLKQFRTAYETGDVGWTHVSHSIISWIGHARHAQTAQLRTLLLDDTAFQRKGG